METAIAILDLIAAIAKPLLKAIENGTFENLSSGLDLANLSSK